MAKIIILQDGTKVFEDTITGPTSYTAGGFLVRIPFSKIFAETISVTVSAPLLVNNFVHMIEVIPPASTDPQNTFKVKVHRIDVTATAPAAWSEVPDNTDISALKINVSVKGI
ncbi:MAG: hypothetical protein QXS96_04750 [Candidatus Caldarchaeum sp.]